MARSRSAVRSAAGMTGLESLPSHLEVVAVVDSEPFLAVPALLSLPVPLGSLTLVSSGSRDPRTERLSTLLGRLLATTSRSRLMPPVSAATLSEEIPAAAARGPLLLDVSGASPHTAIEAFRCVSALETSSPVRLSWFAPRQNRFVVSALEPGSTGSLRRLSAGKPVDIGAEGRVGSRDFLELFGLADLPVDPYPRLSCSEPALVLRAAARKVLQAYAAPGDADRLAKFRQLLAAARSRDESIEACIPRGVMPDGIREACRLLALAGLARDSAEGVVLLGPPDRNAVFFLGGGWLEIACHEALSRALPDREVEVNAGIRWHPESAKPEAEADILFVHGGSLCIVSCKNDFDDERVFKHLRELRALVAEMGEEFVRPTLVSTRPLSSHEESRALSFEIGCFSGPALLEALRSDLEGKTGAFLRAIRDRGHGAPAPGRRAKGAAT